MSENNTPVDRLVTLFGGGPLSTALAMRALACAPEAIAADQGADHAKDMGVPLTKIIGDLDSLHSTQFWRENGTPLVELTEQATTDFEKCLYSVDAALFICVGFIGGRLDHELACMNALAKYPQKNVFLLGEHDVVFLCPQNLALDLPIGTRVSFFPLAQCKGEQSDGLEWPITGLDFAPDAQIGTSNRTTEPSFRAGFSGGPMLCLIPSAHLEALIPQLITRSP